LDYFNSDHQQQNKSPTLAASPASMLLVGDLLREEAEGHTFTPSTSSADLHHSFVDLEPIPDNFPSPTSEEMR